MCTRSSSTGNGPAFSAGHDLSEMAGRTLDDYREIFDVCCELMETVQSIPQPVIAMVRGIATAAGCQLVATCDLAVAAEGARFGTPGVKIGLFCSTPMVRRQPRRRPEARHADAADRRADRRAHRRRLGPGQRVVPAEQLEAAHARTGGADRRCQPAVVGIGKEAFYAQIDRDQRSAYDYTKNVMVMNALAADAQEGMCAFLEKRPPEWTGR